MSAAGMKRVALRTLTWFALAVVALVLLFAIWRAAAWASVDRQARARCATLLKVPLRNGEVVSADVTPAGFEPSWSTALIGVWGFDLPETCRVRVVLRPTPDSHIESAIWMPTATWNQRLQGVGNGGLAGSIEELSMTSALQYNYAVTGTDTGHQARGDDGEWALGHPEKIKDYGWRAIHETAVVAKTVIARFYGKGPQYSYFTGGSNGGREALMEAQRFPEDYDGIVAGAPSSDTNIPTVGWIQEQLNRNDQSYIPEAKLPAISAAVISACDGLDGVRDGLLEDPRTCAFDPQSLLCRGRDGDACLTAPQVATLRSIYNGPGGKLGEIHARGFNLGGEAGWGQWIVGSKRGGSLMHSFILQFNRNLVFGDRNWNFGHLSFERDWQETARRLGPDFGPNDPDLSAFKASGGKIILYHGWADPALQPQHTVDYFERVQARLSKAATASFMRLYMAPGVEHVFGGPGPNVFGQFPQQASADPRRGLMSAVQAWVERGEAPQAIIASKYKNDLRPLLVPVKDKPFRTRPLCPYPQVARWNGTGNIDRADSFSCSHPLP